MRALNKSKICMLIKNCATLQTLLFSLALLFSTALQGEEQSGESNSCKTGEEGGRERNKERMKVVRPPDHRVRDKGGPVCWAQHRTEPVASFVPENFSNTKRILPSCFHPFSTTPSTPFPPLKRTCSTFDLHYSKCMSFKIKRLASFSCSYSKLYSSHPPSFTWQYNPKKCCLMKRFHPHSTPPHWYNTSGAHRWFRWKLSGDLRGWWQDDLSRYSKTTKCAL